MRQTTALRFVASIEPRDVDHVEVNKFDDVLQLQLLLQGHFPGSPGASSAPGLLLLRLHHLIQQLVDCIDSTHERLRVALLLARPKECRVIQANDLVVATDRLVRDALLANLHPFTVENPIILLRLLGAFGGRGSRSRLRISRIIAVGQISKQFQIVLQFGIKFLGKTFESPGDSIAAVALVKGQKGIRARVHSRMVLRQKTNIADGNLALVKIIERDGHQARGGDALHVSGVEMRVARRPESTDSLTRLQLVNRWLYLNHMKSVLVKEFANSMYSIFTCLNASSIICVCG